MLVVGDMYVIFVYIYIYKYFARQECISIHIGFTQIYMFTYSIFMGLYFKIYSMSVFTGLKPLKINQHESTRSPDRYPL